MIARAFNIGMMAVLAAGGCAAVGSGCRAAGGDSRLRLDAADPAQRVAAIIEAGNRNDVAAIPILVDRLEDEDPAVRFYAILALERLTGTRLGFRHEAVVQERRLAVGRWRSYLLDSSQRSAGGTGPDPRR